MLRKNQRSDHHPIVQVVDVDDGSIRWVNLHVLDSLVGLFD